MPTSVITTNPTHRRPEQSMAKQSAIFSTQISEIGVNIVLTSNTLSKCFNSNLITCASLKQDYPTCPISGSVLLLCVVKQPNQTQQNQINHSSIIFPQSCQKFTIGQKKQIAKKMTLQCSDSLVNYLKRAWNVIEGYVELDLLMGHPVVFTSVKTYTAELCTLHKYKNTSPMRSPNIFNTFE